MTNATPPAAPTQDRPASNAQRSYLLDLGYQGAVTALSSAEANADQLTPQEAAAAMGNRGAALLMLAGKVQEIAALIAAQTGRDPMLDLTAPPEGWTLAGAEDGTLILTPPPADPE
jgi:hypothetical protein